MGGFKNEFLNKEFEQGLMDIIIDKLILCSNLMRKEYHLFGNFIDNHEEKIRNKLLEEYLENDDIREKTGIAALNLRFIPEVPEGYIVSDNSYAGRVDIKVVSANWLKHKADYYTIECKRIDGGNDLNQKYVLQGIARFISEPIKYPSGNNRNIMFGFIVNDVDIQRNAIEIDKIQEAIFKKLIVSGFSDVLNDLNEYRVYTSFYKIDILNIELKHLFYNFSSIIR